MLKKILAIVFCLSLTACGFHLRAQADLSPRFKTLYIENATPHSPLTPLLIQNLEGLGVHIMPSPQDAPVTLAILSEAFTQSKTALGTSQQVNSASLSYTVVLTLKDNQQQALISPVALTTSTTYLQNANQILGDTTMLPTFQQSLVRDMSSQILAHLSAKQTAHALSH